MALEPEMIDLGGLPRAIGGGLKREPVEELLTRVQREYAALYYEHKQLKEDVDQHAAQGELTAGTADVLTEQLELLSEGIERRDAELVSLRQQLAEREAELTSLSERLAACDAEVVSLKEEVAAGHVAEPGPLFAGRSRPEDDAASRREIELARIVLEGAHRTSIELRESTRRECELMLRKTRTRVSSLETEFERTTDSRTRQLAELETMTAQIRDQMRATLEALAPLYGHRAEDEAAVDPVLPDQGSGRVARERIGDADPAAESSAAAAGNGAGPTEGTDVPDVARADDVDAAS